VLEVPLACIARRAKPTWRLKMRDVRDTRSPVTGQATGSEAAADQSNAMEGQEPLPTAKPSQAEGDRDTIEQALEEQEESGELY
jgi:hypothetical protein